MGTEISVKEALKLMLMRSGKSIAGVTKELGLGTAGNLSQMINNETMRLKLAASIADVCGYKLVLLPDDVDTNEVDGIEIKGEV